MLLLTSSAALLMARGVDAPDELPAALGACVLLLFEVHQPDVRASVALAVGDLVAVETQPLAVRYLRDCVINRRLQHVGNNNKKSAHSSYSQMPDNQNGAIHAHMSNNYRIHAQMSATPFSLLLE